MLKREEVIAELESRIGAADGINFVTRNPSSKPSVDDMPLVNIFDFPSRAIKQTGGSRKVAPAVLFEMSVVAELFIEGSTEEDATTELLEQYEIMLNSIFTDGMSLGEINCEISVSEMSQVFRPPVGANAAAIGTVFNIKYIEDFSNLASS